MAKDFQYQTPKRDARHEPVPVKLQSVPEDAELLELERQIAEEEAALAQSEMAPGHTDLMVDPETLDAFMEANPLPKDYFDMPQKPMPEKLGVIPYNGSPVEITPDGVTWQAAYWRVTRTFDGPPNVMVNPTYRWLFKGHFHRRDRVSQKVDFEPIGWRGLREY